MENENKVPEEMKAEHKEEKKNDSKIREAEISEKKAEESKKCCGMQCSPERKKRMIFGLVIVVLLLIILGYKYKGADFKNIFQHKKVLKVDEAKAKALDFIDKNLVQPGTKVDISDVVEESGLYKMTVGVGTQKITAYMTKDGGQFFPTAMDMNSSPKVTGADQAAAPAKDIPKNDKPVVDLYVMSFCPYGNKAEDTIKPVYDLLKNKVTFNFHYIVSLNGDTVQSLHGQKEVDEDEREVCVLKNYGKDSWMNFVTYVNANCGSDGACWEAGAKNLKIDTAKISTCVTSQGLELMKTEEKASTDAGASGSPTMLINGVSSEAVYQYGDSEKYKETICSAFNKSPAECNKKLGSETASAVGGSCGS